MKTEIYKIFRIEIDVCEWIRNLKTVFKSSTEKLFYK
jgi:hypothetical protein